MRRIVLVLDNIRSLHNVGSMFRTADGFGVEKLFLTGITGTPDQPGCAKVSLGAEHAVAWERADSVHRVVEELKQDGFHVVGLECGAQATASLPDFSPEGDVAIVLGYEVEGVPADVLALCDSVVEIPMLGAKESFNVAVACGIALYQCRYGVVSASKMS